MERKIRKKIEDEELKKTKNRKRGGLGLRKTERGEEWRQREGKERGNVMSISARGLHYVYRQ